MEESVETLLKQQEEIERKFNVCLQAAGLKQEQGRTHTKAGEGKKRLIY